MQSLMFRRSPGVLTELTESFLFLDNSLTAGDLNRSSRETTSFPRRISGIEGFAVVEGVDSEPYSVNNVKAHSFQIYREQGWRSDETTVSPSAPMWRGFDFLIRCHMWIEFVGSLLCAYRFFPV